jgi:hypothetical protein
MALESVESLMRPLLRTFCKVLSNTCYFFKPLLLQDESHIFGPKSELNGLDLDIRQVPIYVFTQAFYLRTVRRDHKHRNYATQFCLFKDMI